MMKRLRAAAAALNQTPLDWEGNLANIRAIFQDARAAHVQVICFPELCVTGYGCEDMFLSEGVRRRALDLLWSLIPESKGMVCAIGIPLDVGGEIFNTSAFLADGKLLGFAAKHHLAKVGVYYEPRWFSAWQVGRVEKCLIHGETFPVGDLIFEVDGVSFGFEICEDAWVENRFGCELDRYGVDILLNPSASHFAFGKNKIRLELAAEGSKQFKCVYIYANHLGNDAGRLVYDGARIVAQAGKILVDAPLLSFAPWELSTVDLEIPPKQKIRNGAANILSAFQFNEPASPAPSPGAAPPIAGPMPKDEEFFRAVSLGLFDYLRKSRSKGFVVSLSGGVDSATVAILSAAALRLPALERGLAETKFRLSYWGEIQAAASIDELIPKALTCVYQGTENSGPITRQAAAAVAKALGANFLQFDLSALVAGYLALLKQEPEAVRAAGLPGELSWDRDDVSLQNIQARTRGPGVWLIANIKNALLLATSNRSEASVGYTTMDGDTCGGLSPIGGVDKAFLRDWLVWMEKTGPREWRNIPELSLVNAQAPTAELRPAGNAQTDENDLMPYRVLDFIERLAVGERVMPKEIVQRVVERFPEHDRPQLVTWIKRFHRLWSQNQWKRERYAPSFHLDDESVDPKSWCRFPILSGGYAVELKELDEC